MASCNGDHPQWLDPKSANRDQIFLRVGEIKNDGGIFKIHAIINLQKIRKSHDVGLRIRAWNAVLALLVKRMTLDRRPVPAAYLSTRLQKKQSAGARYGKSGASGSLRAVCNEECQFLVRVFARIGAISDRDVSMSFNYFLREESVPRPPKSLRGLRKWPLSYDEKIQRRVFRSFAGGYMGPSHKKGRTYDWPLRHLADGHGEVTPRSFLTLMIEAARSSSGITDQAISAEGICHGLREASKVRVNQLDLEFPWIKRVLAPLAGLQVPCEAEDITDRWAESDTIEAIMRRANKGEFLAPFNPNSEGNQDDKLRATLARIGVLMLREDGRFDMPDLFRVAARLLKKGGVPPR